QRIGDTGNLLLSVIRCPFPRPSSSHRFPVCFSSVSPMPPGHNKHFGGRLDFLLNSHKRPVRLPPHPVPRPSVPFQQVTRFLLDSLLTFLRLVSTRLIHG